MLTLKLRHTPTDRIRVIECAAVDILPCNGGSFTVRTTRADGSPEEHKISAEGSEYNIAYIENSAGSTTQVVRPKGNGR